MPNNGTRLKRSGVTDGTQLLWAGAPNPGAADEGYGLVQAVGKGGDILPLGGTDITASSANAAAANNVSLAGVTGKTTYLTGFEVTGAGATAASVIAITVTGTVSGTLNYVISIPAGVTIGVTPLIVEFTRPIPASGANTAITLSVPSFGTGNTSAAATVHGFQA